MVLLDTAGLLRVSCIDVSVTKPCLTSESLFDEWLEERQLLLVVLHQYR